MEGKNQGFAVWITGLPASGKSTLASTLRAQLAARGVDAAVLESDALREVFASGQPYSPEGRDAFYRQIVFVGTLLAEHGVPVIFDATGNRRVYRDQARTAISRFIEVYLDVPLEVCMARDPKDIYRRGASGAGANVPGLQDPYEAPEFPDVVVHGGNPDADARRIVEKLLQEKYLR